MLTNIKRTSALTCRHKDLGGKFKEYIRMAVPMTYGTVVWRKSTTQCAMPLAFMI